MATTEVTRAVAKSEALRKAASALMPEAAPSPFRSWPCLPEDQSTLTASPPVIVKGKGARLVDVDGNEYVDYIGAHGALILGHADELVVAAISKAASKGCAFGAPSDIEVRLAEIIASRFTAIEMLCLVDAPSDALTSAINLACAFAGRDRVITFDGYVDGGASAKEVRRAVQLPGPPGGRKGRAASGTARRRRRAGQAPSYNDTDSIEELFHTHGPAIAAVLVEPVAVGMGLIPPVDGFLESLRRLCDAHGALLIFDEIRTGFRIAPGGAAMRYGVTPDLVLLGSLIGGGLPLAAYGGRSDVIRFSGVSSEIKTLSPASGNLLGMAAGLATLQAIGEPGFYDALEARSARLEEGLRAAATAAGVPTYHTRVSSMLGMFFSDGSVTDAASARRCNVDLFARYILAMLDRGILLPPSPSGCLFVSAAHTDEDIDRTIEAAHDAMHIAVSEL